MEPGKVFTREELKQVFKFHTIEAVDAFLDKLEGANTPEFKVMKFMDERVLVFEVEFLSEFEQFMRESGYGSLDSD